MTPYRFKRRDLKLLKALCEVGHDKYLAGANPTTIHYLRQAIGKENILTANGVGYRITEEGRRRANEILKKEQND